MSRELDPNAVVVLAVTSELSPLNLAVEESGRQYDEAERKGIAPPPIDRMAGVTEKVLPCLEGMPPESVLDRVHDIEKYDRMARRNYGLSDKQKKPCSLDLHILTGRGRTLIAIDQQSTPAQDQP